MIIQALANGQSFSNERRDEMQNILDDISIDEFLKALIVDCDAEEIINLLALNEDIVIAGKPVEKITVVADDGSKTNYLQNP